MRKWFRIAGFTTLALCLVAAAVAFYKRDEIQRLWAVNTLFDADHIVHNFSNMDAAFLTAPLDRGSALTSELPQGPDMVLPDTVAQWIEERSVTSLLVLKEGETRHESYHLGTEESDLRVSWSVAKSYLSVLFGILLSEGKIASLDDEVVAYAPSLRGTAYDGATLRNVLNMASGVAFDEDYLDYDSDINRMGRELALGGTLDGFTANLNDTVAEPGTEWRYVSMDTHVLGMVIRGATGETVPALLSDRVMQHLGLEQSGHYLTDGAGVAFVLGGINQTTRDFARFGLMVAQDGQFAGKQIAPKDWIAQSTRPSAPTAEGKAGYGFQWWIPRNAQPGEFLARGVYGQYIYIDQGRDVVIVVTAADRGFRKPGVSQQNISMLRTLAQSL
ncbi:serine hydrolase [Phaeobacter sp.]|uniref:serine hydrolase domain-containing protein n=1 Tax=Phaeobacter sp. TaxID=1902409 RepID=UPI0025E3367E|nr:serine hydrolase [Phaeobacter sp.]